MAASSCSRASPGAGLFGQSEANRANTTATRYKKLYEKPHERASRLTMKRIIATYMNASEFSGSRS